MTKSKKWAGLNLLFFGLTVLVNYLGASGFFNDMGQKDVSDKYPTLITPAPFTFSIWGVIYLLVLASLIFFFIKSKDTRVESIIESISPLFIATSLFNMAWIILFSYEQLWLSSVVILLLLIALMLIIERLYKMREETYGILPGLAFSLYAGWVFIASIVNISSSLVKIGWSGFGLSPSVWTLIMLGLAVILVLAYLGLYKNPAFPIGLAWAYFGIYRAYKDGLIRAEMSSSIEMALIVGILIFILAIVVTFIKNGYGLFPREEKV